MEKNKLLPGEELKHGESIRSNNEKYQLSQQADGNLVLYDVREGEPIWNAETVNQPVKRLVMQGDGNLVQYDWHDEYKQEYFQSNTNGNHGAYLVLTDLGELKIVVETLIKKINNGE